MGEMKIPLSLKITSALKEEMQKIAKRERRSVGNLGEVLVEWGMEQLRANGGSVERLLNSQAVPVKPKPIRESAA